MRLLHQVSPHSYLYEEKTVEQQGAFIRASYKMVQAMLCAISDAPLRLTSYAPYAIITTIFTSLTHYAFQRDKAAVG